jgi:hypothetical protein
LAIPASARVGAPPGNRLGCEPYSQAATGAQAGVVLSPVGDLLAVLGDVVPAIGVDLERPGGRPSRLEGFPLRQPARRRPIERPAQQDAAKSVPKRRHQHRMLS